MSAERPDQRLSYEEAYRQGQHILRGVVGTASREYYEARYESTSQIVGLMKSLDNHAIVDLQLTTSDMIEELSDDENPAIRAQGEKIDRRQEAQEALSTLVWNMPALDSQRAVALCHLALDKTESGSPIRLIYIDSLSELLRAAPTNGLSVAARILEDEDRDTRRTALNRIYGVLGDKSLNLPETVYFQLALLAEEAINDDESV